MKLKNKKTGEIIDLSKGSIKETCFGSKIQLQATDRYNKPIWNYNSLAELNEVWEDAPEKPKDYWYIDADGEPLCEPSDDRCEFDNNCREIGNYFETREEAEKAVEKLKAWKRLKNKGLHFTTFYVEDGSLVIRAKTHNSSGAENWEDLDLLFGGEE